MVREFSPVKGRWLARAIGKAADCGGGRTINKLAALAREGKVYGIGHAEARVVASRKTKRKWIELGRVEIQQASVSHLPFSRPDV